MPDSVSSVDPNATPPPASTHIERPDGSVQILSTSAYRKLKEEARNKGIRATQAEIDAKVKAMGFNSLEEAMAYAAIGRTKGNGTGNAGQRRDAHRDASSSPVDPSAPRNPGPAPQPPTRREIREDPRAQQRYEAEKARWQTQRAQYQRSLAVEKTRRRKAERENDELRTALELERIATSAGIKRTKFAVEMLREHIASFGGDEAKIKAFDEKAYFESLRASEPWLFNETVKPATTGTKPNGNGAPPPPAPGQTVRANAGEPNNGFDARRAKPEEVHAQLQSLGISPMGP